MTQLVNNYLADLENIERKWKSNVVDPFCLAYIDAHKNYTSTLKKQKAIDKQQAELAYLALSLIGGSILTELFRKASVSSALKEGAVAAMFRSNSMTAFNITASLEASPTANFIIGSLYTAVSGQIKKEVTTGIQKSIHSASAKLQLKSPLEIQITFNRYLRGIIIQAADFAKNIRDNTKISDSDKNKIIERLKLAPIANPPTTAIGKPRAAKAKDMELLFYMNLILNSDYLRTLTGTASRGGGGIYSKNHGAITTAPSSSNYPGTTNTVEISGGLNLFGMQVGGSVTRTVHGAAYYDLGKALKKRLEVLYKEKTGNAFYQKDNTDISFVNGIMGHAEMLRAENMIKTLSKDYEVKLFNQNKCPTTK